LTDLNNDVVKWRVLVNMAMNFSIPKNSEYLDRLIFNRFKELTLFSNLISWLMRLIR
jgi:hypothetical protein